MFTVMGNYASRGKSGRRPWSKKGRKDKGKDIVTRGQGGEYLTHRLCLIWCVESLGVSWPALTWKGFIFLT